MSKKSSNSSISIGFFGLLTLLFIGLKLTGFIEWSWWFVLLPLYGPTVIALLMLGILFYFEYMETKQKIQAEEEYIAAHGEPKKSKFMEKLEVAMKESEERRNKINITRNEKRTV